jgi:flagellin-like protein
MQSFPRNRNDSVLRLVMVKFRRIRKAVSPVIAVLLMIAIAVIAAILAYMWVTGYIKFTSTKTGKAIQIQSASYTGTHLLVYVQNVGQGTVRFVAGQCLYLDGVLREKATMTRDSLQESETVAMTDNISLYLGQTINIKVVTDEGTSVEKYFTVNIFTGDYTLTVRIVGNGRVDPSGGTYFDESVLLNAIPDDHWVFSGWSGGVSGTTNPVEIYMNESKDVTATFIAIQHQVTFDQNGVGSDFTGTVVVVDGNDYGVADLPKSFLWDEASVHSFSFASPLTVDVGKRYVWTSTSENSAQQSDSQFTVPNNDGSVTGNYGIQFCLTVDNGGHGAGSGENWYNAGSSATFSIEPTTVPGVAGTQYVFTGWVGSGSGSYMGTEVSYSVTMNNPITETAQWKTQYQVTFDANPSGEGTTTPEGSSWYDAGDISISATPTSSSYRFTSWTASGSITFADSSSASTTATISGSGTITANFSLNTVVQITITSDPEGLECVNVDGTNYTTPQTFTWTIGDAHTFLALSPVGSGGTQYVYVSWSDGGAQIHDYVVPGSSETVVANYKTQYLVTFSQTGLDGTSAGTVVMIGGMGGITKTAAELPFTDWFDDGTVYSYNAIVSSSDPDREFRLTGVTPASPITSSGTITGSYKVRFYVTFDESGIGSDFTGTIVTIDGNDYTNSGLPTHFWWDDQSVHTFTFQSALIVGTSEQYVWTSTIGLSALQSGSLTVSASGTVTGNYQLQYQVTFAVSPSGSGTTSPPIGTAWYNAGSLSISANANPHYAFSIWSGTASITITSPSSASTTATINSAGTITANFIAPLDHFGISAPSSVTAGTSFDDVTVMAYDFYGNIVSSYTGQVYFTSSDTSATLPYTSSSKYTFTSGDNGVHTFSGFILRTQPSQTITVTNGSISATSNAIIVVTSTPSNPHYQTSMTPTLAPASTSTSYTYTVQRTSGSYSHTNLGWVAIQVPASFSGVTVTSITASSGKIWDYSVSGSTIIIHARSTSNELTSSGQTVIVVFSATAPSTAGIYGPFTSTVYEHYDGSGNMCTNDGSDPTILVYVPGVLDHFTITGYPSSRTAGQDFGSYNVVATAYDGGNNILTGYTGQVYFTSTDSQAVLPYTSGSKYTFVSGDNGVHTFAGTGFTLKTAGSQTITVTDGSVSATSNSITVNPASAWKLVYTAGADQTLATGQVSSVITVQRQDQYDNPTTTGDIQVNLATNSVGGGFYSNSGCTTSINHVHIYNGQSTTSSFYYKDTSVGTPTLTASSGSLTPATTQFTIQEPKASPDIASSFTPHSGIQPGNQVIDTAKLVNATADAGGSFTYRMYSGIYPFGTEIDSDTKTVTNGVVPDSKAFTVSTQGPYYFINEYSGDSNNNGIITYSPESFIAWPSTQTVLLRPNGDTSDSDLGVYPPSTPHYLCVNEVSQDDDATYVSAILTNYWTDDTYQLPNLGFTSGIINYVTIHAVARTTGYGLTQLSLTTHGSQYDGTDNPGYPFPLTSGWLEYTAVWPTNPYTGNTWTIQEINDLLVGCSLYTAVSGGARCTQVYVEVYYTPVLIFGNTQQGSNPQSIEGRITGGQFVCSQSGTAQSIAAYVIVSSTHSIKAAIYTSSGTLVGSTEERSISTSNDGWVTFDFSGSQPNLAAGTTYTLVAWSNSVSGSAELYYSSSGGTGTYYSSPYGSWPNSVSFSSDGSRNYSIYCTYTVP